MRTIFQRTCLGLVLAISSAALLCGVSQAGERRGIDYDQWQYENDSSGMIDAINRDHGTPARNSYSGYGTGPHGYQEINPYEPDKWFRDEVGMIDAINRDYGVPPRQPFSGVGTGPSGRLEVNPYDPWEWFRDDTGMIDAINRDHPPVYGNR